MPRRRAAVVSGLRLPLAAVALATLFTLKTGAGAGPLIIVGVAVAYLITAFNSERPRVDSTAGDSL
jgi:hypothetical protein